MQEDVNTVDKVYLNEEKTVTQRVATVYVFIARKTLDHTTCTILVI